MFDALTGKLNNVFRGLSGRGRISEKNVRDAMREVRTALLEADVNYAVVKDFCESIVQKALGAQVIESLHPGQVMIKIVHDELIGLMGPVDTQIYYVSPGPTVILLAGLQGSGKTTTAAKLARYLVSKGKKPMLVADDLQRPAAIDQLKTLGAQLDLPVYSEDSKDAVRVAVNGVREARKQKRDVVVLDTAGRLHIDQEMMGEIRRVCDAVQPQQIFLVCDSMTGQDAVNSAKEFNEALELDGVVLTKLDGDARGGAALSVKAVTGKPIKFIGVGEKLDRLEEFHPDRMASRILGMGDVVSLVEKAQQQYSEEEAQAMQAKMAKGDFTFDDFLKQMQSVKKMGGMKDMLKLLPGVGSQLGNLDIDDKEIARMEAIVHSMTREERRRPDLIDSSRRRRIARGSGTEPHDVSGLVKTFNQSRQMMKAMSSMGVGGRMNALKAMGNLDLFSGKMPKMKVKQRSKRKRVDRKKKNRRR
ncbi:MAG: signal recognition particle protein [Sedimentisphaerales bacterium]|nr:signal recognition particle protein [Sedimentisphaerales bacterium]